MIHGIRYTEKGIKVYEEQMKMNKERWLAKNAKDLGYQLVYQGASQVGSRRGNLTFCPKH
jgi:hypothetical protein